MSVIRMSSRGNLLTISYWLFSFLLCTCILNSQGAYVSKYTNLEMDAKKMLPIKRNKPTIGTLHHHHHHHHDHDHDYRHHQDGHVNLHEPGIKLKSHVHHLESRSTDLLENGKEGNDLMIIVGSCPNQPCLQVIDLQDMSLVGTCLFPKSLKSTYFDLELKLVDSVHIEWNEGNSKHDSKDNSKHDSKDNSKHDSKSDTQHDSKGDTQHDSKGDLDREGIGYAFVVMNNGTLGTFIAKVALTDMKIVQSTSLSPYFSTTAYDHTRNQLILFDENNTIWMNGDDFSDFSIMDTFPIINVTPLSTYYDSIHDHYYYAYHDQSLRGSFLSKMKYLDESKQFKIIASLQFTEPLMVSTMTISDRYDLIVTGTHYLDSSHSYLSKVNTSLMEQIGNISRYDYLLINADRALDASGQYMYLGAGVGSSGGIFRVDFSTLELQHLELEYFNHGTLIAADPTDSHIIYLASIAFDKVDIRCGPGEQQISDTFEGDCKKCEPNTFNPDPQSQCRQCKFGYSSSMGAKYCMLSDVSIVCITVGSVAFLSFAFLVGLFLMWILFRSILSRGYKSNYVQIH